MTHPLGAISGFCFPGFTLKRPRLIRTATAVIVAGGLAVMVLSAQDDLDTVRQAAEQGDATAQFNLGNMDQRAYLNRMLRLG